jgi:hypothetical protein
MMKLSVLWITTGILLAACSYRKSPRPPQWWACAAFIILVWPLAIVGWFIELGEPLLGALVRFVRNQTSR